MQLIQSAAAIAIASLSMFSTPVLAQITQERWVDFGKTNTGETLRLNESSIKFEMMLVDDSLNNEEGASQFCKNTRRLEIAATQTKPASAG